MSNYSRPANYTTENFIAISCDIFPQKFIFIYIFELIIVWLISKNRLPTRYVL